MKITIQTIIKAFGNNTAIYINEKDLLSFNQGKRVPLKVTLNGYHYQSTSAVMDEMYLIPLSKEHRLKAGVIGGQEVEVTLELESKNRDIEIPKVLTDQLIEAKVIDKFQSLSYSSRKEYIRQITEAKKEETLLKRIQKILDDLT
jgi:Bacteriocin-protection, YdeI or OmpD-Associated/Domain of unknown function (DUF1905)